MSSKHPSESPADCVTKKRHSIPLEHKMKIINQQVVGKVVTTIACDEHLSQSTVYIIIEDKKRIIDTVKASASIHSMIIKKKRSVPLEEMEQLLVTWMEDQIQKRMPLGLLTIQTKARLLFEELKKNYDDTHTKDLVASHGWFQHFKTCHNSNSVKISSEVTSADAEGAAKFKDALHKIIVDEGYLLDEIFNVTKQGCIGS
ncbi:tigger transposable element-derived protein 1-like [Macrobrachium rosenbergii]|uniref:tigger transposable element-derived protein 1-like n=1 Tax=Macrobrachium rosenbergii TaxID=79674 RepID=UPI0034D60341